MTEQLRERIIKNVINFHVGVYEKFTDGDYLNTVLLTEKIGILLELLSENDRQLLYPLQSISSKNYGDDGVGLTSEEISKLI